MTERKWTPGPWSVTKDGKNVCGALNEEGVKPAIARYTNEDSHLIAAAPDLYEALDGLFRWVKNWDAEFMDDDGFDRAIYENALAKARGEVYV